MTVPAPAPKAVEGTDVAPSPTAPPHRRMPLGDCPCRSLRGRDDPYKGAPLPLSLLYAVGTRRSGAWLLALLAGSATTVASYAVFTSDKDLAPGLLATGVGFVVLCAVGYWVQSQAEAVKRATDAYLDQFEELCARCCNAWLRLDALADSPDRAAIRVMLVDLASELGAEGPQWLDALGYLNAWSHLHDAEEALLLISPDRDVIAAGFQDLLRLQGSDIPTAAQMQTAINNAIPHMSAIAGANFNPPVGAPNPADPGTARNRLHDIREAINSDRDDKWMQVVRARNGILLATVLVYVIVYLVVIVAVNVGVQPRLLLSASVFFSVGALVSAAHKLADRAGVQSEVEDFGYANVGQLVAPLLSGVTAVMAVALFAFMQVTVGGVSSGNGFTSWQMTFDWSKNASGIWVAALFGLVPSALFSFLQARVNSVLDSLKASDPTGAKK